MRSIPLTIYSNSVRLSPEIAWSTRHRQINTAERLTRWRQCPSAMWNDGSRARWLHGFRSFAGEELCFDVREPLFRIHQGLDIIGVADILPVTMGSEVQGFALEPDDGISFPEQFDFESPVLYGQSGTPPM